MPLTTILFTVFVLAMFGAFIAVLGSVSISQAFSDRREQKRKAAAPAPVPAVEPKAERRAA